MLMIWIYLTIIVIGAVPGSHTDIDWYQVWRNSPEIRKVHAELEQMKRERSQQLKQVAAKDNKASFREFAAPFSVQLWEVQKRVFEQYWRTPSYIYSKFALCFFSVRQPKPPSITGLTTTGSLHWLLFLPST